MAKRPTLLFLLPALLLFALPAPAQEQTDILIQQVLEQQARGWNQGNLEAYMSGYWRSDSLVFIGRNGPAYGYEATLARYQKAYPDAAAMGQLTFSDIRVQVLCADAAYAMGRWTLKRVQDQPSGYFTLLFKKKNGHWVIVADHSS